MPVPNLALVKREYGHIRQRDVVNLDMVMRRDDDARAGDNSVPVVRGDGDLGFAGTDVSRAEGKVRRAAR